MPPAADYAAQRAEMVARQLRGRGIGDERVLEAMGTVPRERFVPPRHRRRAYADGALPIGSEQTISQPWIVAAICQALALDGDEVVLDVGAGSGYSSAVISLLARRVVAVERIPRLGEQAARTLRGLGFDNVEVVIGDGSGGVADARAFDAIAVHAVAPSLPPGLAAQLAPGGRLVLPIAGPDADLLTVFERDREGRVVEREILGPCRFVPLIGEQGFHPLGDRLSTAMARIVVFGATGYTGRLASEALVKRGAKPVLAARNREKVEAMAAELGGLESAVADVSDARSVRALVEKGDVLLTTVGPFVRWGDPAAEAAVDAGAHYIDSTGEPAFIRRIFEEYGPRAERAACGMLTAFGYDYVPGNLAGALALRDAGERAVRIDVAYATSGRPAEPMEGSRLSKLASGMGGASGGTLSSVAGVFTEPSFAFREGRIVAERGAKRVGSVAGVQGISVGGSEHFALPRVAPGLREVNAYLGWFGPLSRVVQATSVVNAGLLALPGGKRLLSGIAERVPGSTGGPSEAARAQTGSRVAASAYDVSGAELASVTLKGVNGYTFTGEILAWGAMTAAGGDLEGSGALGPADGFGIDVLRAGVEGAGLRVQ